MKLKLTESQYKMLPLLTEDVQNDAKMNHYKATYEKSKGGLNRLYGELTMYNVHDILFEPKRISELENQAGLYAKEVDDEARALNASVDAVPEDVYNRNEEMYENFRNTVDTLNKICYMKYSSIERIFYALRAASEKIWEDEGEYGIYIKKSFTDIKTIDV